MIRDRPRIPSRDEPSPIPFPTERRNGGRPRGPRPKLKRLRLTLIVAGLGLLALLSTAFGGLMAVAADLPKLENRQEFHNAQNSVLLDLHGKRVGLLTGRQNRILIPGDRIAPVTKQAVVAIEDRRFYRNDGVDLRGIARALYADVISHHSVQGGSTIAQQFVKNALAAQNDRTIFEKVREAALAYHLTRRWTKAKILNEYLNSIYFGNGAYGIESAARTYFGRAHPGCGQSQQDPFCAAHLTAAESALLAGIVSSPTAYDPVDHPTASRQRRDVVLRDMLAAHDIARPQYDHAAAQPLPAAPDIQPPHELSDAPYFTSWAQQQVIDRFGAHAAFDGGLRIRTTLDLPLQQAAEQAVHSHVDGPGQPSAALVAIDNKTGQVRAMVGGDDPRHHPFNLATQGQRQPGSSFKPFTLAVALQEGISPESVWSSKRKVIPDPAGHDNFVVNNYEGDYSGLTTLADAMTHSDNSVYAEVGVKVGVARIARLAQAMGIRTPVSHNYAITLGGLRQGVTPLDMAHAYETFADHGKLVTGSILGPQSRAPVGIAEVRDRHGRFVARDQPVEHPVLTPYVADRVTSILQTVITSGTGRSAAIPGTAAGKTGTTENYADAWFIGYNDKYTVAVWVGYPEGLRSMKTQFNGSPVAGGTFPALIWRQFMLRAQQIDLQRGTAAPQSRPTTPSYPPSPPVSSSPTYSSPTYSSPHTYGAPTYSSPHTYSTPTYSSPHTYSTPTYSSPQTYQGSPSSGYSRGGTGSPYSGGSSSGNG